MVAALGSDSEMYRSRALALLSASYCEDDRVYPAVVSGALSLLGLLIVMGLRSSGALLYAELAIYDALVSWRSEATEQPVVSLVSIDERDLQSLGNWPLTDAQMASLLQSLLAVNNPKPRHLDSRIRLHPPRRRL